MAPVTLGRLRIAAVNGGQRKVVVSVRPRALHSRRSPTGLGRPSLAPLALLLVAVAGCAIPVAAGNPAPTATPTLLAAPSATAPVLSTAPMPPPATPGPDSARVATPEPTGTPTATPVSRPKRTPAPRVPVATPHPVATPTPVPTAPPPVLGGPLPVCRAGAVPVLSDVITPHHGYADWALTVLDTRYALPASYVPPDLEPVSPTGLAGSGQLRALVMPGLKEMVQAAKAAGTPLQVFSAYRSYAYQASVFDGWVARDGWTAALDASARPGHSEHQLGTAMDVGSLGGPAPWNVRDWATTKAGAWMAANAWHYGWVMSYPAGSMALTCYEYEPWHYRYVGRAAAAALHASGETLRQWLWPQQ